MDGATFDTYQRITELKNTCFKEEQAEIVVNAIKKSHEDSDAATKSDGKDLRHEMRELECRLVNQLTMRFGVMLAAAVAALAVLMECCSF